MEKENVWTTYTEEDLAELGQIMKSYKIVHTFSTTFMKKYDIL